MPTRRAEFVQTIRAQYLGERMRALRDTRGLTLKYVAEYLGVEFSTLARYERAEWPFRRDHVITLLDVYNIYDEAERTELIRLAENAWRAGHWYRDGAKPDPQAGPIPDRWWIHDRATDICVYSPTVMPELIQNAAYRDEVLDRSRVDKPMPEQERKKRAHEISQRTEALHRHTHKPTVRMTVDERVLRRSIAGISALKAQLGYLVDMVRRLPNLDLHVIPEDAAAHPGIYGGFTVYRMALPYPPVAWVEHWGGGLLLEGARADHYNDAFEHLRVNLAHSPVDSLALINNIKEEL